MADGHIEILIGARADRSLAAVFERIPKDAQKAQAGVSKALNSTGANAFQGYEAAANKAANASVSAQTRAILQVARMREREERRAEAQRIASERRVLAEQAKAANAQIAGQKRIAAEQVKAANAQLSNQKRVAAAAEAAERRARTDRQQAIDRQVRSQVALDRQRRQEHARQARESRSVEDSFAYRTAYHGIMRYAPGALHRGARFANDIIRGAGVDFNVGASVSRNVDYQSRITRLQNQASFNNQNISREALSSTVKGAADPHGFSRADTADALDAFVTKTGDTKLGMQILNRVSARAAATGGDASAYMSAAGEAAGQLGDVKDKAGALINVLDTWIVQGAKGSVEMKDLSSQAARLAAPAGRFEGDVTQRMGELGALAQLAKKSGGASTASEATNAVARFTDQLRTPQRVKQFQALGIDTFSKTEKGQLRNPFAVVEEALVKTQGDPMKLKRLFASSIGDKPVMALATTFNKAGGGEAGLGAVRAQLASFMDTSNIEGKIKASNERRDADPAVRAQKFMATLDDVTSKMMSSVLPSLEKAGPSAIKVAEWLGNAAGWAAENPLKAVGVALAASVARAGFESGIRAAMEAGIRNLFAGLRGPNGGSVLPTGGGVGGPTAVGFMGRPSGAAMLGAASLGLMAGVPIASALYDAGTSGFDKNTSEAAKASKFLAGQSGEGIGLALQNARGVLGKLKGDKLSGFMDVFGAGNGADIKMLEELITQKSIEQDTFRASPGKAKGGGERSSNQVQAVAAPQSGPMPVVIDQNAMTSAMTAALRSGEVAVRVTNLPPPGNGTAADPPEHGDTGRGRKL